MKFYATEDHVKVQGRTIFRDNIRYLGYSASSVSFTFTGKKAEVEFLSDPEEYLPEEHAYVAIYVDGDSSPLRRIELARAREVITIYDEPVEKTVTLTIMKYSEPEYAVCGIVSLSIDTDLLLSPPAAKSRKVQIVGDSITCGYGVEGSLEETMHRTCTENPAKAYSVLAARALDADLEIVAWNGKGVITSYLDELSDTPPDDSWLVPMLYEYTDAGCEKQYFGIPKEKWERWDDSRFEPDLIMVHLGTNDASYTKDIPERSEEFCQAYIGFLETIHRKHPKAALLTMLGIMDQRLCPAVEKAAATFKRAYPDVVVQYLPLPQQKEEDGLGTFWHPAAVTHEKAAQLVAATARKMMGW